MPWKNVSSMEQKQQFVSMAGSGHFTVTELCVQFGISRKTGHKWHARHAGGGIKMVPVLAWNKDGVRIKTGPVLLTNLL